MEKIISYKDLPYSKGQSIYLRMETDPKLFISLISKGYKIIKNIKEANNNTIYVTGRRQDYVCSNNDEYMKLIDNGIQESLKDNGISKPNTINFSYKDLIEHKYKLPFVLKNENQNGGREKFLINTEEDYDNLINSIKLLINKKLLFLTVDDLDNLKLKIDYEKYLDTNFKIQEYIDTPTEFNTTVRLITTPSNDLLYSVLKYKEKDKYIDDTTLLGYLLSKVYPLSTKSIVSNTLSGGKNILLNEDKYTSLEEEILEEHNINSNRFNDLVKASKFVHNKYKSELGIICGFDYIYDRNKKKWFLLEYHSRPMLGDYSKRQDIMYSSEEEKLEAEGRVRATALSLVLKKTNY